MKAYESWFRALTGHAPRPWQQRLAADPEPRSRLIRIPTGYGKTFGVLGAWLFHAVERQDPRWPRRLVWALPMRVLAEQTLHEARRCIGQLGLLWNPDEPHEGRIGVHLLMGGASADGDWNLYPEERAVFIGTQDMLLSRALNRGFAAARARWPMEFGLLNHDALWVADEVQLMDVGLATTAQLQAFFEDDEPKGLRPRKTWWMSATLQPTWLRSVDTAHRHEAWASEPVLLENAERREGLAAIPKSLAIAEIPASDHRTFARRCAEAHAQLEDGAYGRVTLVVCNTVERAMRTYDELVKLRATASIELVHGRFRLRERLAWRDRFLNRDACRQGADRIIVATQVVEAGVDVSAGALVTELAPWSSLVQRFGRCARYGGKGAVVVVDRGRDEKTAAPYSPEELEGAAEALGQLARGSADVGIQAIETFEEGLDESARARLYPYSPGQLLVRRDLDELFDTTPDLTGADIDVSRYIRSGPERDLSVFWRNVPAPKKGEPPPRPSAKARPAREELCAIPFLQAREWLCGDSPRLRKGVRAWTWDWIDGDWRTADASLLTPGRVVCVAADVGGYDVERGFDPGSKAPVPPVQVALPKQPQDEADDSEDSEELSSAQYKTIATHGREAAEMADRIAAALDLPLRLRELLALAGRWHDLGKAHPNFQGAIRAEHRPARGDLAKAPDEAWLQPPGTYRTADDRDTRHGLRHELASCLALFAVLRRYAPDHPALLGPWRDVLALTGDASRTAPTCDPTSASAIERAVLACSADDFDLLAYLVLCHHGKVRVSLHASPKDQEYVDRDGRGLPIRGVRSGDVLPSVMLEGEMLPELVLSIAPAALGISPETGRSWRDRTLGLQKRLGPAALAWLEAILIAADRRASRLTTSDPLLEAATGGAR